LGVPMADVSKNKSLPDSFNAHSAPQNSGERLGFAVTQVMLDQARHNAERGRTGQRLGGLNAQAPDSPQAREALFLAASQALDSLKEQDQRYAARQERPSVEEGGFARASYVTSGNKPAEAKPARRVDAAKPVEAKPDAQVRDIQNLLLAQGGEYKELLAHGANGLRDAQFSGALRHFQEEHKLPATGELNRDTVLMLNEIKHARVEYGTSADQVDLSPLKRMQTTTPAAEPTEPVRTVQVTRNSGGPV